MADAGLTYDIFGYIGSTCLTILYVPQVYQVYHTQKAEDLAFLSLLLQILTSLSFLTYGYGLRSYPIIVANISGISCSVALLVGKWKFRKKVEPPPQPELSVIIQDSNSDELD